MSKSKQTKLPPANHDHRRLSLPRVFLFFSIILALAWGAFWYQTEGVEIVHQPPLNRWFAPYVDVTATPYYEFEQSYASHQPNLVLSFIVADKTDPCKPTWGTHFDLETASTKLDLERRVALYRQQGGSISVSFGGLLNNELAVVCQDHKKLKTAYQSVIDLYQLDTIDLDIEGAALSDTDSLRRRSQVISQPQKEARDQDRSLAVWLTLPVATFGLTEEGATAVQIALEEGLDLAGVNGMTMNYGGSKEASQSMGEASKRALIELHRQLKAIYARVNQHLTDDQLWSKVAATPMIGQNDLVGEIFTLEDARALHQFVSSKNIQRLSIWSANRDQVCGGNYFNLTIVSDACSGIDQTKNEFAKILSEGFTSSLSNNASSVTQQSEQTTPPEDDPATSPYPIWQEDVVYLEGSKTVWRQNVYEAKWWTRGDLPDNPVIQSWETPWRLLGPVLPGEKPLPQPTLPAGTYPQWSVSEIYDEGQRILYQGVPYQARWWTQGDNPVESSKDPHSTPWMPLTQQQIDQLSR